MKFLKQSVLITCTIIAFALSACAPPPVIIEENRRHHIRRERAIERREHAIHERREILERR